MHLESPKISYVFDRSRTEYTVAKTQAVLGELRKGRPYNFARSFSPPPSFKWASGRPWPSSFSST
jgi:hypothetical protein